MKRIVKGVLFDKGLLKTVVSRKPSDTADEIRYRRYSTVKVNEDKMARKYKECIRRACWCYNRGVCRRDTNYCDADPKIE